MKKRRSPPVDKNINPKTGINDDRMLKFFKAILNAYMALPRKERNRIHNACGVFLE